MMDANATAGKKARLRQRADALPGASSRRSHLAKPLPRARALTSGLGRRLLGALPGCQGRIAKLLPGAKPGRQAKPLPSQKNRPLPRAPITKASIVAALLILLLAANLAFPAYKISDIGALFGNSTPVKCDMATADQVKAETLRWTELAWLSLVIGVFFYAGLYALSGTLSTQKYMQFLKGGMWGAIETAAILAIFTGSMYWLYDMGAQNIDTARTYSTVIRNTVMFDTFVMIAGSTALSFISRQSPTIRKTAFRAFPISFQFAPMFRPLFDGMGTMVQLLSAALAEWIGHEFVLCFIKTTLFSTILPIGIFLRAFGIKDAGNFLIAFSLSLFFIYPALMVQVGEMLNNYFTRTYETWDPITGIFPACSGNSPICCAAPLSGGGKPATLGEPFILNGQNAINPAAGQAAMLQDRLSQDKIINGDFTLSMGTGLLPLVNSGAFCTYNTGVARSYGHLFEGIFGITGVTTLPVGAGLIAVANKLFLKWTNLSWVALSLYPLLAAFMMNSMYDLVFFVFVVSLVLPIIVIFVTITSAREIAKFLGTEIDLSALEKLI